MMSMDTFSVPSAPQLPGHRRFDSPEADKVLHAGRVAETMKGHGTRRGSDDTLCEHGAGPADGWLDGADGARASGCPDHSEPHSADSLFSFSYSYEFPNLVPHLNGRSGVLGCLHQHTDKFPPLLLRACLETMAYCYYGMCTHDSCLSHMNRIPSEREFEQHRRKASIGMGPLAAYLSRILTTLSLAPETLEHAIYLTRRLRFVLETKPLNDADAEASRSWGAHHLVFLVACMLADKMAKDDGGSTLWFWASAGGFRTDVLRRAEMEMFSMLGHDLSLGKK